ncbi:hypothetical protein ACH5RR_027514 [Cinchona calisaya]|uniref:Uncharacterized protein n=1 Tax=Cinchona calisaya TaxID=153742 RepID=A0ABD2Z5N4_9GENT
MLKIGNGIRNGRAAKVFDFWVFVEVGGRTFLWMLALMKLYSLTYLSFDMLSSCIGSTSWIRQDKVEQMLSFYKTSQGSRFQEATTHVRGDIDVVGAMFMVDNVDNRKYETIQNAGVRTGVDLRLVFVTDIKEKNTLIAEFVAGGKAQGNTLERPLSLAKVL